MRFRLTWHNTSEENKYKAEERHEYLGDAKAILHLWYILTVVHKQKHVAVYSLDGTLQHPELGLLDGMQDPQI